MDSDRLVHLTLITPTGRLLGGLPPLQVGLGWENDIAPVVTAARAAYGLELSVLRMRWVEGFEQGGPVGYLAECAGPPDGVPLDPADPEPDHPLRVPWARPGGVAETLRWADGVLTAIRRPRTGAAEQQRTWGLSGIWRLPTESGAVWCKQVPSFFMHEGAVISWLARAVPGVGPVPLGTGGGRMLLADVPGGDCWQRPLPVRGGALTALVDLQAAVAPRVRGLLVLGVPDRRADRLVAAATATVHAWRAELAPDEVAALDGLLAGLPARLAEVAACGLPDTLVHGDFHAGNVLVGDRYTIIDWGDSGVGHPALDLATFLIGADEEEQATLFGLWAARWRAALPGCRPERAAELMRPVAALGQACAYDQFIRRGEPDEAIWHVTYLLRWLHRAVAAAQAEPAAF